MKNTSIPFFLLFCLAQFFPAHDALTQSTPNDRYFSNMHHDPCMPNVGHHDYIQAAGSEGSIASISNGFWDNPNTWQGGIIPSSSKTAIIYHSVTIRNTSAVAFDTVVYPNSGHLQFSPSENTKLQTGTLFTYPGSKLTIGTKANPIQDNKVAEIVYVDRKINLTADPAQYSHGLLVVGGDIVVHGATLPKTFYSLAKEVHVGDMVLELQSVPEQWKPGHILLLPGTEQPYYADGIDPNHRKFDRRKIELVEIDSINGKNVHLKAPAQVNHFGARLRNGEVLHLPHVANLSRNVIFRSANPDGERGHSLLAAGASIDINYAAFVDLGRTINADLDKTVFGENCSVQAIGTNQPARYPFHTHHLSGPPNPTNTGYQFSAVGNAVYTQHD